MARTIIDKWRRLTVVHRLLLVNVAVFVTLRVVLLATWLAGGNTMAVEQDILGALALPLSWQGALRHCWTLVTHMVVHLELWHLLGNLLWLWWMGTLFLEYFSSRQLLSLYALGGFTGAMAALAASSWLPAGGMLLGASGAVTAIMLGITVYRPNYRINLFLIGEVALKWVTVAILVIDVLSIGTTNTGGHLAHLGGAMAGAAFALMIRRGTDITRPWQRRRGVGQPIGGRAMQQPADKPTMEQVDAVLDKIRRSGYDSLTAAERDLLHRF